MTAAAAVVASEAPITAEIVRGLPGETEQALREVHYGPYAVGGILVNRKTPLPWDRVYATATPGRSFAMAYNIGSIQLQPGAVGPKYGSIMVYIAADDGRRLLQEDDETIARTYRDDLAAVFPEVSRRIEEVVVERVKWGTPFAHVGRGRLQEALTRPLGRGHLIGDYLGTRYVDTCAERAETTAKTVRAQLPALAREEQVVSAR